MDIKFVESVKIKFILAVVIVIKMIKANILKFMNSVKMKFKVTIVVVAVIRMIDEIG